MNELTSKIQYKNFETGEFIEEKKRTYEQTIALIEQFPWEAQRDHIIIDLTNPSVTIHGPNQDYLKLALFYNGKFVLHYFDAKESLFTKSFAHLQEAYPYVKRFFEATVFEPDQLRKENTLLQHNLKHFVTLDFHYEATPARVKSFLLSTTAFNFGVTLLLVLFLLVRSPSTFNLATNIILFFLLFLAGGGINLLLFLNYYEHSKNKILIMSRGNSIFYYGDRESPTRYEKSDIVRLVSYNTRGGRSPISGFTVVTLELKDGTDITIPSLLIEDLALEKKLPGVAKVEKKRFPWV